MQKRIVIDFDFRDATEEEANMVCDSVAKELLSEDQMMPTVFECMEANGIIDKITWKVRRESWNLK